MEKIVVVSILLMWFVNADAQVCTPDPQYAGISGIHPDSTTGIPVGYAGVSYNQVFNYVVPADTIIDYPGLGIILAQFDSIVLTDITDLPPGFTYVCNPNGCSFPGNSQGCIVIQGNPGTSDIGTYPIVLVFTASIYHVSIGHVTTDSHIIDDYPIVITASQCAAGFTLYPDTAIQHNWFAVSSSSGTPPLTYNWNWGDGNSSTGSNPSHIYNTPGYYNICVTVVDSNACSFTYCDSSTYVYKTDAEMISVTIVDALPNGIEETWKSSVKNYPNPTNGIMTIESQTPKGIYQLQDLTGKHLLSGTITATRFSLDISTLSKGIYLLSVFDAVPAGRQGEQVAHRKIVKE